MEQGPETWTRIAVQIQAGESEGQVGLYECFGRALRFYFSHHLEAQDVEDRVHDTVVAVVSALRNHQLNDPARLPGYVFTIARRQVASYIDEAVRRRGESADVSAAAGLQHRGASPEQAAIERQRRHLARQLLGSLAEIDRQILLRFYYQGQSPDEICREMRLTETQFRLRKSRAKQRFELLTRKMLRRERLFSLFPVRREVSGEH